MVASIIHQILLAVNFMHYKNIMHRDLKLENIMCEDSTDLAQDEIYVKLTDFGFATKFKPGSKEYISLGTPYFMAPEIVKFEDYDCKVDCWAIGIIAFLLLSG